MKNKEAIEALVKKLEVYVGGLAEGASEPEFSHYLYIESGLMLILKTLREQQEQSSVDVMKVKMDCYNRFKNIILDGRARHGTNPKMSEKGKIKAQIISDTVDHLQEQGYLTSSEKPTNSIPDTHERYLARQDIAYYNGYKAAFNSLDYEGYSKEQIDELLARKEARLKACYENTYKPARAILNKTVKAAESE